MVLMLVFLTMSSTLHSVRAEIRVEAITSPSADVTLSFVQPGRIMQVLLKEGDTVKADQILVRQDDAVEQARLAQIKALKDNRSQLDANEASLAQKKVDLEKIVWARGRGAATVQEVDHATLDVTIAELQLDVANFDHEQNGRKYDEEKIRVDNMTLKSPISGMVEKVDVEVGESVNALIGVVRIVRTDPLWIDLYVPLAQAKTLKAGATAQVQFPDGLDNIVPGKVIFVAAVADAASSTLRARIEVPNKSNRSAGEHVTVVLAAIEKTD
jgi:membrane fusion protein (multidrug efflux system)